MKRMLLAGFLAYAALAASAPAQETTEAERRQVALEIIKLTTTDVIVASTSDAVWGAVGAEIRRLNPEASDELLADLESIFRADMAVFVEQNAALMVDFYADEFTLEELRALDAFYRSEVGQKLLAATPRLMQEFMPQIMRQMQQTLPQVVQRLFEEAERRGLTVEA